MASLAAHLAGVSASLSSFSVDFGFIAQNEGSSVCAGYVPCENGVPLGHSGVTVGIGVDLGQQSPERLEELLGAESPLLTQLSPFCGLQGAAAVECLQTRKLSLEPEDVKALNEAVMSSHVHAIAACYDRDCRFATFRSLPADAQTAIADLAYQYGSNLKERAPHFWSAVTRGRWLDAYNELMHFGDGYTRRRQKEAALLHGCILAKSLPSPS